jgi:hypothetical protein
VVVHNEIQEVVQHGDPQIQEIVNHWDLRVKRFTQLGLSDTRDLLKMGPQVQYNV